LTVWPSFLAGRDSRDVFFIRNETPFFSPFLSLELYCEWDLPRSSRKRFARTKIWASSPIFSPPFQCPLFLPLEGIRFPGGGCRARSSAPQPPCSHGRLLSSSGNTLLQDQSQHSPPRPFLGLRCRGELFYPLSSPFLFRKSFRPISDYGTWVLETVFA